MVEKLNTLLPKIEAAPQMQTLKLPKLKKSEAKTELPKLKLPKLKKNRSIMEMNHKGQN